MLRIKNYHKSYKNHKILEISSLEISEGIHWFRGANGSGKSTFFKSIAGIVPFEGEISLNNLTLKNNTIEYLMLVNLSEAEPQFPDFLSGYDILKFVAESKKGSSEQLLNLANWYGITEFWKKPLGTYSSGMLKKISLVGAFLGNPKLIMLDEPLITIDDQSVELTYQLVSQKYEQENISFLLSSHQDFRFDKLPIKDTYMVHNQTITKQ